MYGDTTGVGAAMEEQSAEKEKLAKEENLAKRSRKSLPATFIPAERFSTKRDLAKLPKQMTCPPLECKKTRFPRRKVSISYGNAKLVRFNKFVTELSPLYDRSRKKFYVTQIFHTPQKIGEGSFGKVYRAVSKEDGKDYALKKLKGIHGRDSKYAEVRNLEKLDRRAKNCIKYFMAWEENECVYIKLEFCPMSLSLYAWVNHDICEEEVLYMTSDLLEALRYLHNKHLLHMDVKPANIMVTAEGRFKLGDFGLMLDLKMYNAKKNSQLKPLLGSSEGDARYVSSEVLTGVRDFSGDVFALGITLLEICCDIELPKCGQLWHDLRNLKYPDCFYKRHSDNLILLISYMMQPDYKKRPTAAKLLATRDISFVLHLKDHREKYAEAFIMDNNIMFPVIPDSDYEMLENNNLDEITAANSDYMINNQSNWYTPPRNSCNGFVPIVTANSSEQASFSLRLHPEDGVGVLDTSFGGFTGSFNRPCLGKPEGSPVNVGEARLPRARLF